MSGPEQLFNATTVACGLRLVGRIVAGGLFALVATLFLAERPDPTSLSTVETRAAVLLLISVAGMLLLGCSPGHALRLRIVAAVANIGGMAAFYVHDWWVTGTWPGGWVLAAFFVPGATEFLAMIVLRSAMPDDGMCGSSQGRPGDAGDDRAS